MIEELKQQTITTLDSQDITDVTTYHLETIVLEETMDSIRNGFKLYYDTSWELQYGMYWIQELTPRKDRRHYHEIYLEPDELRSVVQWLSKEEQTSQVVREYRVVFPKKKQQPMIDL